ncbi:hypothetical protein [Brevundimonas sp.]|uniref:hypothetical protein n=1 Tax=Brevundimonas sp. TaxID=1871086 RepID=UPI0037BF5A65
MGQQAKDLEHGISDRGFRILKAHVDHLVEPLPDHQLLALADALHATLRQRRADRRADRSRIVHLDARPA